MHISWAILIFLFTWGFPLWARCLAALFVILTACATLGFGQHYFMDLVVAAPLVLLIRALFMNELGWADVERSRALGVGFALLAFWIGMIRFAPIMPPPSAILALTGLTLCFSALFERALARAERRAYMREDEPADLNPHPGAVRVREKSPAIGYLSAS
jgi:hypothetical protein